MQKEVFQVFGISVNRLELVVNFSEPADQNLSSEDGWDVNKGGAFKYRHWWAQHFGIQTSVLRFRPTCWYSILAVAP